MNMIEYCAVGEKIPFATNDCLYKDGSNEKIILSSNNFSYYDNGCCSYIYKFIKQENILLKVYNIDFPGRYRLSKTTFDLLKSAKIPNIVELYDRFYMENNPFFKFLGIDAYSMKEVLGERIKLIDYDRKHLIEIMKSFEETLKKISKMKIQLCDMHKDNIILTSNGITIIDCDQFLYSFFSRNNFYEINKISALNCLNTIIRSEFPLQSYNTFIDTTPYASCLDIVSQYINNMDENTIREHLENQICKKKC